MKQGRRAQKFILHHWWTYVSWKMPNWRQTPKVQRSCCTPRRYRERWFFISCSIHWTRDINFTNDSNTSHGYHVQTAWVRRTSSGRNICLYPGKNGRSSKITVIPKSENPDIWIRLPRHKWAKSWSSKEDPVILPERNLYGHPLPGLLCKRQFEKILLKYGWEESFQLGMLIRTLWKSVILIYVCGWHKIGWQETKHLSDVEITQQRSRFGRTWIMYTWDALKDNVEWAKMLWTITEPCSAEKYLFSKSLYFSMVLRHGRSCNEMCGAILWVSQQDDSATLQRMYSMHRRPPLQSRRNDICWRNVTSMLSNCSEMHLLGTNWTTWYFMVSE